MIIFSAPKSCRPIDNRPKGIVSTTVVQKKVASQACRRWHCCSTRWSCSIIIVSVPAGSSWRGGDVTAYVKDINQPSFPTLFFFKFCSCVYFCPHGPFNCISFHKFSRHVSVFSLCSSGLISAPLVLSTIGLYRFMKVSFSSDNFYNP